MNHEISPPQNVVAVSGDASLAVTWTAPVSNGGSNITDYLVKYSSNGGVAMSWKTYLHPVSPATSLTITGLTNGKRYVIKVIAKNAAGSSSQPSANSAPVIPTILTAPGAPTSVVAVPGNTSLAVTWVVPVNTGGSNVTFYLVQYSSNSGSTWTTFNDTVSATSLTVTGLTNGTAYVIRVIAVNAIGNSQPSGSSAPATPFTLVVPSTVPGRPTSVVATRDNASLAVTWVAPASNGGSNIIEYIVKYSNNNGATGSWKRYKPSSPITATSLTVTGLANGTAYVIKVIARNAIGISLPSVNSLPVTPATVPDAPTSVVVVLGNASLAVTWVAPTNNGGSPITDYLVQYSSNSGSTWTTFNDGISPVTSLTITGLTNGTAYLVRVSAVNAAGSSSTQSISQPVAPGALPGTPTFLEATNKPKRNLNYSIYPGTWDYAIELKWSPPLDHVSVEPTEYVIKEGTDYHTVASLLVEHTGQQTYTSVGLVGNHKHSYFVYAKNSVGLSAQPAMVSLTTAFTRPDTLTGVSAFKNDLPYPYRGIFIRWDSNVDGLRGGILNGYIVEYADVLNFGGWYALNNVPVTSQGSTSITIRQMPVGVPGTWAFRVSQVSNLGASVVSDETGNITYP